MTIQLPLVDFVIIIVLLPVIGVMVTAFIWLSVNEKTERENRLENRPEPDNQENGKTDQRGENEK